MPTKPAKHIPKGQRAAQARGWAAEGRGSRHERGYGAQWDKLRLLIMARDKWLCQPCIAAGRVTQAKAVDHRIPKAAGGGDDHDNLQAICTECHKQKTQRDRHGEGVVQSL